MRTVLQGLDETLHAPLVLKSDTTLSGGRVRIADDFKWAAPGGIVQVPAGSSRVTIEDLSIEGPSFEWWAGHLGLYPLHGISVFQARNVTVRRCRASNLSAAGFYARDFDGLNLLDFQTHDCNAAVLLDWPQLTGNKNLLVDGLLCLDTWGLEGSNAIGPSILRKGQHVGTNIFNAMGLETAAIRNVRQMGEGKGMKVSQCRGLTLEGLRVAELYLGGVAGAPPGWHGPTTSGGYLLTRSVIGESTFGFSEEKTQDAITLVLAGAMESFMQIADTVLIAPRPGLFKAPWQPPAGVPFRYQTLQAIQGFKAELREGVRFIDLNGDEPEPTWITAETGAIVTEVVPAPRERYTPQWLAP